MRLGGNRIISTIPEIFEASVEAAAPQSDDAVGASERPVHPGALETSSDGDFASGFEDARRSAEALFVELWIAHAVAIARDIKSAPGSIGAVSGMRTERMNNGA